MNMLATSLMINSMGTVCTNFQMVTFTAATSLKARKMETVFSRSKRLDKITLVCSKMTNSSTVKLSQKMVSTWVSSPQTLVCIKAVES